MGNLLSLVQRFARTVDRAVQHCCADLFGVHSEQTLPITFSNDGKACKDAFGMKEPVTPAGNPLPLVLHRRLTTTQPGQLRPKGRCVFVGDVHGCIEELETLLDQVAYCPGRDNLFITGDLVSKGPASLEVLRKLRELRAFCIRGNNDDGALAAYAAWRRGEPVLDKFAFVSELREDDVAFLSQLPFTASLPEYGAVVVHAGIVPGLPLWAQPLWALCTMRVLHQEPDGTWQPYDGEKTPTPINSIPCAQAWGGPQHIIFGHDSKRGLQLEACATGIDTGCVSGGALTACVLPPLGVLRRSEVFVRKVEGREPLGLGDLQGRIVSVPSLQADSPP